MQVREWVNKNSAVVTIISVVLLAGALFYLVKQMMGPTYKPITHVYYYDVISNTLFEGKVEAIPPIETPSGNKIGDSHAGVRANVFSCTKCSDASSRYIGYLETYTPAAQEAQRRMDEQMSQVSAQPDNPDAMPPGPSPEDMMALQEGRLVASAENTQKWFKQESEAGAQLVNDAMKKCPDNKYPTQCFPGH